MLDRELLAIPAAEYVRLLAGLVPNRAGKVLCPFHDETDPSLQLYPDGSFYCYGRHSKDRGCRKGGTIFDFAAALWGIGTRDQDFLELRQRLPRIRAPINLEWRNTMPVNTGRRPRVIASLVVLVMLSGCAPLATGSRQPDTRSPTFASEGHCVERHGLRTRAALPARCALGCRWPRFAPSATAHPSAHRRATPSR